MDKNKIDLFKELLSKAGTDEVEVLFAEYDKIADDLTPDERNEILRLYDNGLKNLEERVKNLHARVCVKDQLEEITEIISLKYIAKKYFGKTSSWLYNKMNGAIVNGKPVHFTTDEIHTLNGALQDISKRIGSISVTL